MAQKFRAFLIVLALILLSQPVWAQGPCADNRLEKLPVLAGGRVKPLVVHAKETLKTIIGKRPSRTWGTPTEAFCKLTFNLPLVEAKPDVEVKVKVVQADLKNLLGLAAGESWIAVSEVQGIRSRLFLELQKLQNTKKDKTPLGKALNKILFRIHTYSLLEAGSSWMVPIAAQGEEADWISFGQFRAQMPGETTADTLSRIQEQGQMYLQKATSTVGLELLYHRLRLMPLTLLFSILGLALIFATQNKPLKTQFRWGSLAIGSVVLLSIVHLTFRILIAKRGPVTNMYETVMWVGLGTAAFAWILAYVKKAPLYFSFGVSGILLTSFMNQFAASMVDPAINPLVPVLRDNFWLSTHVTTVTISYAAFTLSWLIANTFMFKSVLPRGKTPDAKAYNDLAYAGVKIGVVLIAAGTILGGIWADYSWGRFWGWDPKETWALITLLIYVGILHGRYAGWIKTKAFLPALGLAYLSVLMCWFGVNYILASGLHSYGFSENGAIFLGTIFLSQIALNAAYYLRKQKIL